MHRTTQSSVIAGDVDPEKTLPEVKRLFGPIPKHVLPPRRRFEVGPLHPGRIAMDTDLPTGRAIVAYRLPGFESPDYAVGRILADVLDSKRGELYAIVPQGEALFGRLQCGCLAEIGVWHRRSIIPERGRR